MDPSGQYHRRPQTNCLPINFPYTGAPVLDSQAPHQMFSFDGLPRSQHDDQQFMNTFSATNIFSSNFNMHTSMPIPQTQAEWNSQAPLLPDFDDQTSNEYYGYSTAENYGNNSFSQGQNSADIPRTWPSPYETRIVYNTTAPNMYEPSGYMIDVDKQDSPGMNSTVSYDARNSSRDFARLSISHSLKIEDETINTTIPSFDKPPGFNMASRESSNDSGNSSREMTVADIEDHGADEPYAKLIYRALMSAPNHSMALQEIYQWFRDNTVKGRSDTKGWMNSIRHNLSMNAAFKKTERKVAGDETKKSTEWVLEDFAIKDGVQSTTRYRKGTGNKKFVKSENPAPSRQSSGRKGGICASKTKFSRQKAKDDRSDPRRSIQKLESGSYLYHQSQHQPRTSPSHRQVSPLTPCPESLPSVSSYLFHKSEAVDIPFDDMCGLGDVQEVYVDGPLFSNDHDSPLHTPHPMIASQRY